MLEQNIKIYTLEFRNVKHYKDAFKLYKITDVVEYNRIKKILDIYGIANYLNLDNEMILSINSIELFDKIEELY